MEKSCFNCILSLFIQYTFNMDDNVLLLLFLFENRKQRLCVLCTTGYILDSVHSPVKLSLIP